MKITMLLILIILAGCEQPKYNINQCVRRQVFIDCVKAISVDGGSQSRVMQCGYEAEKIARTAEIVPFECR
jgi:hypothetical protein